MSRNPGRRERARQLRRDLTPAEQRLWRHLRGRRLAEFKFRRQHPVGPFFVDMACVECQLLVELDGESHLGAEARDAARDAYLEERGWLILRFWNTQVYDEIDG